MRVTQSDGVTEVPLEIVSLNTAGTDGELYFELTHYLQQQILPTTFIMVIVQLAAMLLPLLTAYKMSGVMVM